MRRLSVGSPEWPANITRRATLTATRSPAPAAKGARTSPGTAPAPIKPSRPRGRVHRTRPAAQGSADAAAKADRASKPDRDPAKPEKAAQPGRPEKAAQPAEPNPATTSGRAPEPAKPDRGGSNNRAGGRADGGATEPDAQTRSDARRRHACRLSGELGAGQAA